MENGLLTNKLSMKRNIIVKKYAAELDSLYTDENAGHPIVMFKKAKEEE